MTRGRVTSVSDGAKQGKEEPPMKAYRIVVRLLAHLAVNLPRDIADNGANLAYDLGDGR